MEICSNFFFKIAQISFLKLHKNFPKNAEFRVIYLKFTFAIDK